MKQTIFSDIWLYKFNRNKMLSLKWLSLAKTNVLMQTLNIADYSVNSRIVSIIGSLNSNLPRSLIWNYVTKQVL